MPSRTLYIAASHQSENIPLAHCLGDVLTSIRVAQIWIAMEQPTKVILSLCEGEQWNILWYRFIRETSATVIYDRKVHQKADMYWLFDQRRKIREINGIRFDIYKELYCRYEGGARQHALCGSELGLGRRNVFEYFYYGQESSVPDPTETVDFGSGVIDVSDVPRERKVLIAPYAKCQGNDVFTFDFWREVTNRVLDAGIPVTINDDQDRLGIHRAGCDLRFSIPSEIANYIASHALVVCGNTGVGWVAGATNTPLMGMEPPYFDMLDYRYREAGVRSVAEIFAEPNVDRVVNAICTFMSQQTGLMCAGPTPPPRPVTAPHKLANMERWLKEAPPGPVVEVGVFQGGSLIHLAEMFPDRHFYGYDTFEGMPPACGVDNHHRVGDFTASFDSVRTACAKLPNITLTKGRYPDSDTIRPQGVAMAHVDVDIYESTRDTIEHLMALMAPRSRLYCDDAWVDSCHGATIAMCEVAARHKMFPKFDHGWHAALCFGE
jgi:hypothetical protein